ncbi:P-loop NTPase family protein [Agrococcus jejuensis]|uniref:Adenylate kinase n=1 Tax=Agrococcus jejuensis TaxID=399736 RepID=A0A1G8H145_9MICO|nr:AAA family ATPase [Agrococcus jejuensis]SDI00251.1 Adenylate kinase [Agrococcus jejuensis]
MLGPDDPLPRRPDRIIVAGTAGTGKTTLSGRIGDALGIDHVEIDGLHWGADWTPRPSFSDDVDAFVARDRWVTEWQYRIARERLAARADLLVWLDYPVAVSMQRVVRRTLRRRLQRIELWHGNVEPALWTFVTDRDHIVRWAWRTRAKYRDLPAVAAARHPHLTLVRLRSQGETDRWMRTLAASRS